jgi:curved DNA-binding protein CbpA
MSTLHEGDDPSAWDVYAILGIDDGLAATTEDLRVAFRDMSRRIHPDRNPDDPDAGAKFDQLKRAYVYLTEGDNRAAFDAVIKLRRDRARTRETEDAAGRALRERLEAREQDARDARSHTQQKSAVETIKERDAAYIASLRQSGVLANDSTAPSAAATQGLSSVFLARAADAAVAPRTAASSVGFSAGSDRTRPPADASVFFSAAIPDVDTVAAGFSSATRGVRGPANAAAATAAAAAGLAPAGLGLGRAGSRQAVLAALASALAGRAPGDAPPFAAANPFAVLAPHVGGSAAAWHALARAHEALKSKPRVAAATAAAADTATMQQQKRQHTVGGALFGPFPPAAVPTTTAATAVESSSAVAAAAAAAAATRPLVWPSAAAGAEAAAEEDKEGRSEDALIQRLLALGEAPRKARPPLKVKPPPVLAALRQQKPGQQRATLADAGAAASAAAVAAAAAAAGTGAGVVNLDGDDDDGGHGGGRRRAGVAARAHRRGYGGADPSRRIFASAGAGAIDLTGFDGDDNSYDDDDDGADVWGPRPAKTAAVQMGSGGRSELYSNDSKRARPAAAGSASTAAAAALQLGGDIDDVDDGLPISAAL